MSHHGPGSNVRVHSPDWDGIVRHYETCLKQYGTTPRGVDWPNGADLADRFGVMLELLAEAGERPALLDLGCGPGLLLDYLAAIGRLDAVEYRGIDLSSMMIDAARTRWPAHDFSCMDILASPMPERSVDVVIMNGVLTERATLSVERMMALAQSLVAAAFRTARVGVAFNVMNAHVDWQRDDLFHWPFDALAAFLRRDVTTHYSFRADYGLYEYTCFAWRRPQTADPPKGENWWAR
jgi:SAM-dependent methyltransferase